MNISTYVDFIQSYLVDSTCYDHMTSVMALHCIELLVIKVAPYNRSNKTEMCHFQFLI